MSEKTYVVDETSLGTVRVTVQRRNRITVEDVVETQTKALLGNMRFEARRRALASGNNELEAITYYVGRL